ncbi:MAG: DUF4351 domain-containing protein [Cyanophyceae cyanobacterium]
MQHKFGSLPFEVKNRLRKPNIAQLKILSNVLLNFTDLADLEAWLDNCH